MNDDTFFSELKILIEKYEIDKISNIPSSLLTEFIQEAIFAITKANVEATKIYREAIETLQKELVDRFQRQPDTSALN